MGIDKIGPINNYNGFNKINKKNSNDKVSSTDSVKISNEALNKAETNKIMEIVNNAPDVRIDRVNEVKEKLKNSDYIDEMVTDNLAEKIMEAFEI